MKQLILVCLAWVAFSSEGLSATNINQAGKDACLCLKAPYQQHKKIIAAIRTAKETGDLSQLQTRQNELIQLMISSTACFEDLSKNYPEIDQSDALKKQVADLIQKMCPVPTLKP